MIITVIGAAGGVGQATCTALKTLLPPHTLLRMVDVNPSILGVALDVSHVPTSVRVQGFLFENLAEALSGTDIVLLTAGMPRKPGMTREDLFTANANIVCNTMRQVAQHCPNAFVAIVTNPVNSIVPVAAKVLQSAGVYNEKKLCGVTMLDVIRAQVILGDALGRTPESISVNVIGGHSGITILPLLDQVQDNTLSLQENRKLREKIQNAGTHVVEAKAGAGSATLSMGVAGAIFVTAVAQGLLGNETSRCAYVATPEQNQGELKKFGVSFFAKPVVLGKEGIMRDAEWKLSADEMVELEGLMPELKADIEKGMNFSEESV